jgi:hypothetical protein
MNHEYIAILSNIDKPFHLNNEYTVYNLYNKIKAPLSTKEILKRIKQLNNKNITYDKKFNVFNNCHLQNILIKNSDNELVKNKFDKTTLFIIEISSRVYKENKNNQLIKLTDDEIENDIIQIRKELYPKQVIIIPPFFIDDENEKKYITNLLSKITTNINIPFINIYLNLQCDNKKIEHNILLRPLVGILQKKIIHISLDNKIREIKQNSNRKYIYQTYYIKPNTDNGIQGFGDFIRGCIYLYKLTENSDINLQINFSNTFLNDIFYCKNHLSTEECEKITYFFRNNEIHFKNKVVFTNKYHDAYFHDASISTYIDDKCRNFIINNCFILRDSFKKQYLQLKRKLKLNKYVVIHIRTKDWEMCGLNKLVSLIKDITQKYISNKPTQPNKDKPQINNTKILLISNNKQVIDNIDLPYIVKTGLEGGHTGFYLTTAEQNMNTIMDFILMTECEKIYQISSYFWGSGFSDIVNKIFKIPIEKYKLIDD